MFAVEAKCCVRRLLEKFVGERKISENEGKKCKNGRGLRTHFVELSGWSPVCHRLAT